MSQKSCPECANLVDQTEAYCDICNHPFSEPAPVSDAAEAEPVPRELEAEGERSKRFDGVGEA